DFSRSRRPATAYPTAGRGKPAQRCCAIVLFSMLLEMLTGGAHSSFAAQISHFVAVFLGGLLVCGIAGYLFGAALPFLGGSRMAEVTLSVALAYVVYLLGEHVLGVSGVVAVVSAGLTGGALARVRLRPASWRYLERVWEQNGFWASFADFRDCLDAGPETASWDAAARSLAAARRGCGGACRAGRGAVWGGAAAQCVASEPES